MSVETKARTKTAKQENASFDDGIMSSIVINGDISRLSPEQKVSYYQQFCERVGLDPLSQPFKLLRLNGKEILYCDRSGAQQLNKIHRVSHEIRARETVNGCYVVTAQASTPDGRRTESIGAVTIDNLRGDNLCNAMMKAETKAKRRATLDLLGLGILDETETETIPQANKSVETPVASEAGTKEATERPNHISQFKRRYETEAEIRQVIDNAKEIRDIANLYYINAELVESLPELKMAFSEKKSELYGVNVRSLAA